VQVTLRSRTQSVAVENMRIDIPSEQEHLKKKHAGGPDGRSAPKPWQYVFSQKEL